MFFAFDGLDGVGKTTQLELFCQWLAGRGHDVVRCVDPGSTPLGEKIRSMLLERHGMRIDPLAEMLLFMAARAQMVSEVIRPASAAGRTVVSDRFLLANVVYQGYARGLDVEEIWQIGRVATGGIAPDLTLVLDMPVDSASDRLARPLDRMETGQDAAFRAAAAERFSGRSGRSARRDRGDRRRSADRRGAGRDSPPRRADLARHLRASAKSRNSSSFEHTADRIVGMNSHWRLRSDHVARDFGTRRRGRAVSPGDVRGRLASTFLFVGPRGIGKHTLALRLAQAFLCQARPIEALDPCGACDSCLQVAAPDASRSAAGRQAGRQKFHSAVALDRR